MTGCEESVLVPKDTPPPKKKTTKPFIFGGGDVCFFVLRSQCSSSRPYASHGTTRTDDDDVLALVWVLCCYRKYPSLPQKYSLFEPHTPLGTRGSSSFVSYISLKRWLLKGPSPLEFLMIFVVFSVNIFWTTHFWKVLNHPLISIPSSSFFLSFFLVISVSIPLSHWGLNLK